MKPITILTLVFASILPLANSPALADEPKGDLATLQGSWSAKVGPNKDIPIILTIKMTTLELKVTRPDNEEITLKGEIKLDEKASPKACDWLKFTGPDGQEIGENKVIYKIEGDTWTTCSGGPGNDRPTKFEGGEVGPPNLTTWIKVKPKADDKPAKTDLDKFQGTWTAPAGPNEDVIITLIVKDKSYTAKWDQGDGNPIEIKGEFLIDEKTKLKTIDFLKSKRSDGEELRDNMGIYAFDGEKVTVCVGGAGNPRPTEFKAGEDGQLLLHFVKKKD